MSFGKFPMLLINPKQAGGCVAVVKTTNLKYPISFLLKLQI